MISWVKILFKIAILSLTVETPSTLSKISIGLNGGNDKLNDIDS